MIGQTYRTTASSRSWAAGDEDKPSNPRSEEGYTVSVFKAPVLFAQTFEGYMKRHFLLCACFLALISIASAQRWTAVIIFFPPWPERVEKSSCLTGNCMSPARTVESPWSLAQSWTSP
jgi:hypothetical protein